jgi:WD40 repeat protein
MIDPQQMAVVQTWAYPKPLLTCRYAPSGRWLVSSAEDFQLQRWDTTSGEHHSVLGHESWVYALAFTRDSTRLISGGCDWRLVWWDLEGDRPEVIRTIEQAHRGWIRSVDVSPDGELVVSGGDDGRICLWRASDGEPVGQWLAHPGSRVYQVRFLDDQSGLISGDLHGQVHLWGFDCHASPLHSWDASQLYATVSGKRGSFGGVRSLVYHAERGEILVGGLHKASNPLGAIHEPCVLRLARSGAEPSQRHVAEGITQGVAWDLGLLADGSVIGVSGGGTGGFLLFWDDSAETTRHQFKLPSLARGMDLAPDKNHVATAHYDRHIRVTRLNPEVKA